MKLPARFAPGYAPAVLAMLLPAVLLYSSIRTFQELGQMKAVFLRNRSAAIAAKLETLSGTSDRELQVLLQDEPGVIDIRIISERGDTRLIDLWNGRELFRTEMVRDSATEMFRAFIPFHYAGQLRIARIDLDADSADFLLVHARHNVVTASVSGAAILLLAGYVLWSIRRTAMQEKQHLEMAHLTHLGKMSAVLAHEIRTPLASIKGFTQLALEKADRDVRCVLEPVVTEAQRLERLVSDLLLYGRPPQPVLGDCSWDEIASSLGDTGPNVYIDRTPLRFRTDGDMLRQVISNLVRNASDAVAGMPDGWVRVSIAAAGERVVIRVDDNGAGIPESLRQKVFESFFTTKSFGTGLGLPIARSLTAALGGELLMMRRPGGGVRVEVRLPAAGARSHAAEVTI